MRGGPGVDVWTIEEAAQADDQMLGRFYFRLTDYDRMVLEREHISVNGDLRVFEFENR